MKDPRSAVDAICGLFPQPGAVIAMIHTGPSPGVPGCVCVKSAVERAAAETEIYLRAGVDGLLVENMHDFPCVHERRMGPEVSAFMTRVASEVKRRAAGLPVGIQTLFQANRTAVAVALAAGCDFIRAEGWTYAHVSDKGVAEASAGEVLRYRKMIGADHIPVLVDVRKKHASHALTADLSDEEVAAGMKLHGAAALVATGPTTGAPPEPDRVESLRRAADLPLFVGSGVTPDNVGAYYGAADGFIVGSALKEHGRWHAPVSARRVERMVSAVQTLRAAHHAALPTN